MHSDINVEAQRSFDKWTHDQKLLNTSNAKKQRGDVSFNN